MSDDDFVNPFADNAINKRNLASESVSNNTNRIGKAEEPLVKTMESRDSGSGTRRPEEKHSISKNNSPAPSGSIENSEKDSPDQQTEPLKSDAQDSSLSRSPSADVIVPDRPRRSRATINYNERKIQMENESKALEHQKEQGKNTKKRRRKSPITDQSEKKPYSRTSFSSTNPKSLDDDDDFVEIVGVSGNFPPQQTNMMMHVDENMTLREIFSMNMPGYRPRFTPPLPAKISQPPLIQTFYRAHSLSNNITNGIRTVQTQSPRKPLILTHPQKINQSPSKPICYTLPSSTMHSQHQQQRNFVGVNNIPSQTHIIKPHYEGKINKNGISNNHAPVPGRYEKLATSVHQKANQVVRDFIDFPNQAATKTIKIYRQQNKSPETLMQSTARPSSSFSQSSDVAIVGSRSSSLNSIGDKNRSFNSLDSPSIDDKLLEKIHRISSESFEEEGIHQNIESSIEKVVERVNLENQFMAKNLSEFKTMGNQTKDGCSASIRKHDIRIVKQIYPARLNPKDQSSEMSAYIPVEHDLEDFDRAQPGHNKLMPTHDRQSVTFRSSFDIIPLSDALFPYGKGQAASQFPKTSMYSQDSLVYFFRSARWKGRELVLVPYGKSIRPLEIPYTCASCFKIKALGDFKGGQHLGISNKIPVILLRLGKLVDNPDFPQIPHLCENLSGDMERQLQEDLLPLLIESEYNTMREMDKLKQATQPPSNPLQNITSRKKPSKIVKITKKPKPLTETREMLKLSYALKECYKTCCQMKVPFSFDVLREKSHQLAEKYDIPESDISEEWLDIVAKRIGLRTNNLTEATYNKNLQLSTLKKGTSQKKTCEEEDESSLSANINPNDWLSSLVGTTLEEEETNNDNLVAHNQDTHEKNTEQINSAFPESSELPPQLELEEEELAEAPELTSVLSNFTNSNETRTTSSAFSTFNKQNNSNLNGENYSVLPPLLQRSASDHSRASSIGRPILEPEIITIDDDEDQEDTTGTNELQQHNVNHLQKIPPTPNGSIILGLGPLVVGQDGSLILTSTAPILNTLPANASFINSFATASQSTANKKQTVSSAGRKILQKKKTNNSEKVNNEKPTALYKEMQTHFLRQNYPEVAKSMDLIRSTILKRIEVSKLAHDVLESFESFGVKYGNLMMEGSPKRFSTYHTENKNNNDSSSGVNKIEKEVEDLVVMLVNDVEKAQETIETQ